MPATTSVPFTLRVEDLGRLAEAEVELRPMTLFVGENNSGKTYLATLIWAIHYFTTMMTKEASPGDLGIVDAASACLQELRQLQDHARQARSATPVAAQVEDLDVPPKVRVLAERTLGQQWKAAARERLVRHIEALAGLALLAKWLHPKISVPIVGQILNAMDTVEYSVQWQMIDDHSDDVQLEILRDGEYMFGISSRISDEEPLPVLFVDFVLGAIIDNELQQIIGTGGAHEVLFFPASRTGIIQNLPLLTDRQLRRGFTSRSLSQPVVSPMPAPVQQFLSFLVNPGRPTETGSELCSLIEQRVIGGQFRRGGGIDYTYTPQGQPQPLTMSHSSAVVTELLPLWLLVSTGRRPPLLVYEEPEAHLHPRLQRVVAVVLARLARQGTKVLVTTHSETFAQQINNLIKRGGLDREARDATAGGFPYVADDYLTPDDVAGYEFRFREDGRSYTERLEVRPDGIVMPMFNKELLALTDEAIRLDEALAAKQAGG